MPHLLKRYLLKKREQEFSSFLMMAHGQVGKPIVPAGNWGNDGAGAAGELAINFIAFKTLFSDITANFTAIYAKVHNVSVATISSIEVGFYLGNVRVWTDQISIPANFSGWVSKIIAQNIHADCLACHIGSVGSLAGVSIYFDVGAANQTRTMPLASGSRLPNPFVPVGSLNSKCCLYGVHT